MADFPLASPYVDAIKRFEAFVPRAAWDYRQFTNGYGTRAQRPGEVIDRDTAEQRLGGELGGAAGAVDRAFPGLAEGPRAALTSLTFNAGPGWINSGLGKAVASGDMDTARGLFQQYVKAGGQTLSGLVNRRNQEAQWFSSPLAYTGGSPAGLPEQAADMQPIGAPTYGTLPQGNKAMPGGLFGNGPPQGSGLLAQLIGGFAPRAANWLNENRNAIRGSFSDQALAGGQIDRSLREADQSKAAIFQSLVQNGAPPQLAQAAAANPHVFQALAPAYFDKQPKLVEIGTDPLTGDKKFAWSQPGSQSLTPAQGAEGQQTPGADLVKNPQGLAGEDYLKALPPAVGNTIRGMLEGRSQPPSSFAASKPYWQMMLQHAANAEPGFDLTKWSSRVGTAKDFASGQAAKNITSLNTVIGHLGSLKDTVDKLDNSNFTPANSLKNTIQVLGGRQEPGNFNVARNAVADELARVFRSAGMSDHEINSWKENISASGSPEQLKGSVSTAVELLNSRLDSLKDQYTRGMGKEPAQLLSSKAQKALDDIRVWAKSTPQNASAGGGTPSGAVQTKTIGGKTYFKQGDQWFQQ